MFNGPHTIEGHRKIYVAGKITGDLDFKEKFERAGKELSEAGFPVIILPSILPGGMEHKDYMTICYAMLTVSDGAVFLPDWIESPGARSEFAFCAYHGIPRYRYEDIINL